ncbi:MAG TPA: hypothetical protein VGG45_00980 [Terracidiphilus sp.]|jgi:hypothetical protein
MRAKLDSAVALCSVFASTLLFCGLSSGQAVSESAFRPEELAGISRSDQPSEFSARFSAFAVAGTAGSNSTPSIPSSSEPVAGGGSDSWEVAPAGTRHQKPFSRIGIGANVSPLGIGINATTVLSDYFDARAMGNFFNYTVPEFEIEGFRTNADLHLASMAASLDWYPFNSFFRVSPGLMLYNGNEISMSTRLAAGTSFKLNGQTFYSANANAATGAVPVSGSGVLGLHTRVPAFTIAGGFGKFVPRSKRHWSFPAEFGVVFMGAPTINLTTSGWACTDKAQTLCGNISDPTNPVSQDFNTQLQAELTKWRADVGRVQIYPIFSYSFVYSFTVR